MDRNKLLPILCYLSLLIVGLGCTIGAENTKQATPLISMSKNDLIIATGNSLPNLFSLSLKAMGGFEAFNIQGKRILIKPTICWNSTSRLSTNPELINRIVEHCYNEGAWEVYVLDHTTSDWKKSYRFSGIEEASKRAFGKVVPANDKKNYQKILLPDSVSSFNIHELVLLCDLIINVPHLNIDDENTISGGIKNLHGLTWENGIFDKNSDARLASILEICNPALTVIDASVVVYPNGKRQEFNQLIIGTDVVALDAFATRLTGIDPDSIGYLKEAEKQSLGTTNTSQFSILKIHL